jgi:putative pyruvate formate lyase activating enzyme
VCKTGRYAFVSSHFAHFGEEDCLRGTRGSGTIFFSWCNLRCVFCQNYDISWLGGGSPTLPGELAKMMLQLQRLGCHNINFVTPEHVVPQILEALLPAVEQGLRLPLVYNTGAYDSLASIELMNGIVDVYMPDFKLWNVETARRYLKAPNYPEAARRAILEMHRQVGPLVFDEHGLALRGVLIRHLVMPGLGEETRQILRWIADELGPDTYVNLMDQYSPAGKVGSTDYVEINRRITSKEYQTALETAEAFGLWRLDNRAPVRHLAFRQ